MRIDEAALRDALGRRKVFYEVAERTTVPGAATGLAVTGVGGDVLFVEATASDGEGGLQLTGQLGDVAEGVGSIALSYLRSHAGELGIGPAAFEGKRFHVHVPDGAVPQGRAVGRRDDDDGDRLQADGPPGAQRPDDQ